MKDVPKDVQDKMIAAITKNPKLFEELAKSAQEKMKTGKSQMDAMMEAVAERQEELKKAMFGVGE